jgi:hypothetical protein
MRNEWFRRCVAACALATVAANAPHVWALTRTCTTGVVPFIGQKLCKNSVTPNPIAISLGQCAGTNCGDRYLTITSGRSSSQIQFDMVSTELFTFDSNGSNLADCHFRSTDVNGVTVVFFGFPGTACDRAVSQRLSAAFKT